jgi:adenosine kinase
MKIVLTGSIAFDYLMTFPGKFQDHILVEKLDCISLSFLVDTLERRPGGNAANIAYNLALLGERPTVMATVGEDFEAQRLWLEDQGVDTSAIRTVPGVATASFFVNTDQSNAQIASFFTGAMAHASELTFAQLPEKPDLVMISPNDPQAMANYALECRDLEIPYIYDPSQQIVRLEVGDLKKGLEGAMAFFANEYEFSLIEEKTGFNLQKILECCQFVVITRGEHGTQIYSDEGEVSIPIVPPDAILDPTGVGDAFRSGFLKGYAHDLSFEHCGQMGALAATYCLESDGPQSHAYDLQEFIARFRQHFDDQGDLDRLT